jgi:RNA-directed DNA polymerase
MNSSHITSVPLSGGNAYNMNANNGNINNNNKSNENYARCVRFEKEKEPGLFSFENIYNSYIECRKNKRNTINALKFEQNLDQNLQELYYSLKNRTFEPGRSVCFIVLKPKPREVFAADFRDRIVHHLIVGFLEKIFEPLFSKNSFACRKNKGTHKAVKHLQRDMRKITGSNTGKKRAFYLQLDIKNFFMSINKKILFSLIKKRVEDCSGWKLDFKKDLLWVTKKIIFHDPTNNFFQKTPFLVKFVPCHKSLINVSNAKGLPIGNYSSQFFANVYLNELDAFVKRELDCSYYVRYVDDFILLSNSKEELLEWFWKIKDFLKSNLLLDLKTEVKLLPLSNGIDFLGYITKTNSVFVRKRVLKNFRNKLDSAKRFLGDNNLSFFEKGSFEEKDFQATFSSYLGHFKHADSYRLKQKILEDYPFTKKYF